MKYCDACGQSLPDPTRDYRLTRAELDALSAWRWARTARGAARLLGLHEQTIKNQLARARQRNACNKTFELMQIFIGRLRTLEELTSHNARRKAA